MKNRPHPKKRREFLKTLLAAGTAPTIMAASVLGKGDQGTANDRVGIGFIGLGTRAHQLPKVGIVAGADVDAERREEFAQKLDRKIALYNDYRELLENPDVDAVVIATPDHWHALQLVDACRAGKDVYCEKPMTLTIQEGRKCIEAVRSNKRIVQIGHNQRSEFEGSFRRACELVRNGYIGELKRIETYVGEGPSEGGTDPDMEPPPGLDWDRWLGQTPKVPYRVSRCHGTFRWWYAYSGGKLTDWGTHHNDIAMWGNETEHTGPTRIDGTGEFPKSPGGFDVAYRFRVHYEFKDSAPIICTNDEPHGVRFFGSEGEIFVDRKNVLTRPVSLATVELKDEDLRLHKKEENIWHFRSWIDCVKSREEPSCPVGIGHRVASLCHLGGISIRLGRPINWDPDKEVIVGDEEAAAMCSRPQREPYRFG